jgi:hypothetical protein
LSLSSSIHVLDIFRGYSNVNFCLCLLSLFFYLSWLNQICYANFSFTHLI